jgi:hypothetical protein
MTPERLLIIEQLLSHPCGVGPNWQKQLIRELIAAVEPKRELEDESIQS